MNPEKVFTEALIFPMQAEMQNNVALRCNLTEAGEAFRRVGGQPQDGVSG